MAKPAFPKLHKAIKFAVKAHKKQDRDGDSAIPYVTHPIEVLAIVRYEADVTDEDMLCTAVLHDVLEETEFTEKDIEDRFGERVLKLVKELTREEPDAQALQLPEQELAKIKNALMMSEIDKMSNEAKLIKLADRCSNLANAFKTRSGEKLKRYIETSRQILDHIDRQVCPVLWDRIKEMIDDSPKGSEPNGAAPKRKNLKAGSSTPSVAG